MNHIDNFQRNTTQGAQAMSSSHHRDNERPEYIPVPVYEALRDWEAAR